MSRKVAAMLRGAVATCSLMPMPVVNSAASALTTPIMASLPLMVSGAAQSARTFKLLQTARDGTTFTLSHVQRRN